MLSETTVYVAIELKLVVLARRDPSARRREVPVAPHRGRRHDGVTGASGDVRRQASTKLGCVVDVASCFEAGRDGLAT